MNLPLDLDTFDLMLEQILLNGAECGAVAERLRAMRQTESTDNEVNYAEVAQ